MKLLPGAVERGQSSYMPAEVLERAGIGPCGTHDMQKITVDTSPTQTDPRLEKDPRHLEVLGLMSPGAHSPHLPVFTEASTKLQGEFLLWPVITSFWNGFSPSSTNP